MANKKSNLDQKGKRKRKKAPPYLIPTIVWWAVSYCVYAALAYISSSSILDNLDRASSWKLVVDTLRVVFLTLSSFATFELIRFAIAAMSGEWPELKEEMLCKIRQSKFGEPLAKIKRRLKAVVSSNAFCFFLVALILVIAILWNWHQQNTLRGL